MIATAINQFKIPRILADTSDMSVAEWRETRRNGLGGSDAAGALGLSRYSSPITVYFSKVSDLADIEDTEKMEAGRKLEPIIAEWFAEKTGKHIVRQPYMYQHPEHDWMLANVDFGIYGENAGLECKNTAYELDKDWEEGIIPDEHYLQCNHYMAVTGAERWYIVYLVEGWKLRWVVIERDEDLIQTLIEQEKFFWETYVVPQQPPAFDGSASATALLKKLYPSEEAGAEPAEIPDELDALWEEQAELGKQATAIEKRRAEIKNQICSYIGGSVLGLSSGYTYTWKTQERSGYTVEPTSFRVLRAKKNKAAK